MKKALSVKQFNEYIKSNIKHDPIFQRARVSGDLANLRQNGPHLYFSLKEGYDVIDCVIYYFDEKDINFDLTSANKLLVDGSLSLNNYSSRLTIVVRDVSDIGLSKEYLEFLKIKKDFESRGYFDNKNKKPIKSLVKNVGLISSKDGAAIVDFLAMINSKPNDIRIVFSPTRVQGQSSIKEIVRSIKVLDTMDLDVIVITRGGGSKEDLSGFNQAELVEAIFTANTPIITAIGHNIDTSLVDYVSDLSLQTPTEAGSFLVKDYGKKIDQLSHSFKTAMKIIENKLTSYEFHLELTSSKIENSNPKNQLIIKSKDLNLLKKRLDMAIYNSLESQVKKLKNLAKDLDYSKKLINLNKEKINVIKDNKDVFSKYSLKTDDLVKIEFSDGEVLARIVDG